MTDTATSRLRARTARPRLTWNLVGRSPQDIRLHPPSALQVTPEWAWGGSTGAGVRVCILDSGVEADHPDVGPVQSWHAVEVVDGEAAVVPADPGDTCGHGTACAGIVRSVAMDCEIHSVRVLNRFGGGGEAFVTGLRWAIEQRFDVINLSLSTNRAHLSLPLRMLADEAYFSGSLIVASAHNLPMESFPWRFSSVVSVGSHSEADPALVMYNPTPPVEFFAHGTDIEVAWLGGGRTRCTGNSFATPHVTGRCARILAKHPGLTPFQVKSVLYLTADNVKEGS